MFEETGKCLENNEVKSEGLSKLSEQIKTITNDEKFEENKTDIKKMLDDMSCISGALIGLTFLPFWILNILRLSSFFLTE